MDAALPFVSVVIPCHNAAPFLAEAVESALAQQGVRVEVIVVDDASTDGSVEVARGFGDRIRRIELARNAGAGTARNTGAAVAAGDALLFLDADDVLAPGTLAALAGALRGTERAVAACSWARLRPKGAGWIETPADRPPPDTADPLGGWLRGAWVPTCALLWSRAAYEAAGGWDPSLHQNEDGDLALRAFARDVPLVLATGGRGLYRTHGAARLTVSTDVFSERRLRSQVRVMEKLSATLWMQGRMRAYAETIGLVYHQIAQTAFRAGFSEIGRDCQARGRALAGERTVGRTWAGRLLGRMLGMEGKERLVSVLSKIGIATPAQRTLARHRTLAGRAG
jgi:glycosyltransferase involved in cell wall biosynthesis